MSRLNQTISIRRAASTMLIILSLIVPYHVLIITSVIPYDAVWGGRLTSMEEMLTYEMISISVNLWIIYIIAMRGGYIKLFFSQRALRFWSGLFSALFLLNSLGNTFSNNVYELVIFTPITLLFTVLCYRLALKE